MLYKAILHSSRLLSWIRDSAAIINQFVVLNINSDFWCMRYIDVAELDLWIHLSTVYLLVQLKATWNAAQSANLMHFHVILQNALDREKEQDVY